jgi:hypothetical protein
MDVLMVDLFLHHPIWFLVVFAIVVAFIATIIALVFPS